MLVIQRRRTFTFTGTFYETYISEGNPGNVPFNLTGGTARAQIREKKRGKARKEAKIIANLNPIFPSPTTGVITISHTREFTTALTDRSADEIEWDLIFTDAAGRDWTLVPPQPVLIFTPPTNPLDDSSDDFVPGGGGHIYHTHPINQVVGLQAALNALAGQNKWEDGVTEAGVNSDNELFIIKDGTEYYVPLFER